jgi:hypothetical protein
VGRVELRLVGIGREQQGERVVGAVVGQRARQIRQPLAGDFERRFVPQPRLHAQGIVQQHDPLELGRIDQAGGHARGDERPPHEQRQEQDRQAAQQQQDQVFQANSPAVFLVRIEQKVHRRPIDDLELPLVEEVDDDRNRHRRRTGRKQGRVGHERSEELQDSSHGGIRSKFQISSTKFQTNSKLQTTISFCHLHFQFVCDLVLVFWCFSYRCAALRRIFCRKVR